MLLFRNEPAAESGANLHQAFSDRQLWAGAKYLLLIGLAMTISKKSWHLLSKDRTCTITPLALLRVHFERRCISTGQDTKRNPMRPRLRKPSKNGLGNSMSIVSSGRDTMQQPTNFGEQEEARAEIDFYRTIDQSNREETPPKTEKQIKEQTPASSHQ